MFAVDAPTVRSGNGQDVPGGAEARLDEAQQLRFRTLRIDVFDVKTGYDPVGDYVRRRLEELGQ